MGRHGMKYCIICNPEGNGSHGIEGTEAVGKYFNEKTNNNQLQTGWLPVCARCAKDFVDIFPIIFFDGTKTKVKKMNDDPRINSGSYEHDWSKDNLVTMEIDGMLVDHCVCSKCGAEGHWFGAPFAPKKGCSVPDSQDGGDKC